MPLKTCPHCAKADLPEDAKICKHCGRRFRGDFGFLIYLQMTGVLIIGAGGFYFWPLWIVALLMAITIKVQI